MERRCRTRLFIETLLPDITFAAAAVLLVLYYLRFSRFGINVRDEWSLVVAAQRMINGDLPFVHDRSPVILSFFFLYPPVKAFRLLVGSYTGVILFVRCFYVAVHAVFSAVVYLFLRRYRWFAVFAAVNYMCFIPNEIFSVYYNSVGLMGITLFCLLLFLREAPGKLRLAGSGFSFACAVLALPHLAILYFIWTAFVLIAAVLKRKNGALFPSLPVFATPKGWAAITVGIALCAGGVIFEVTSKTGVSALLSVLPDFWEFSRFTSQHIFQLSRLLDLLRMTGYVPPFLLLFLFIAAAADRNRYRRRLFYLTGAAIALAAVYAAIYADYYRGGVFFNGIVLNVNFFAVNMRAAPFYMIGFFAFLLTKKRNDRLFLFLIVCVVFSVARDLSSNVVVGLGGAGADIAAALLLRDLYREWKGSTDGSQKNSPAKRAARLLCVLPICLALLSEGTWKLIGRNFAFVESGVFPRGTALSSELTDGPLDGVLTTVKGKIIYQDTLKDLSQLKERFHSVYIAGMALYGYLYLDLPCPADNVGFDSDKIEPFQVPYWEQFPEKRPDCIYVPLYNLESFSTDKITCEKLIELFGRHFSFTTDEGAAGYILSDLRLKEDPSR